MQSGSVKRKKRNGAKRGASGGFHGVVKPPAAQRVKVRKGPEAPEHTTTHINEESITMSPSEEVEAATGEAPTKTTLKSMEQLTEKRAELADATKALCEAERVMDTDRAVAAKQRIAVLRGFITRLETDVRDELEQAGRTRAESWQEENAKTLTAVGPKIKAAQDVVRKQLNAAVDAIKTEVALRASVEQLALADEVLSARFGLQRSFTRTSVSSLPGREDWVMPILLISDAMRPERLKPHGLVIGNTASATPEQRKRNALKAVAEFSTTGLPVEVQAILAEAPIDPDVLETPEERARRVRSEAVIGTRGDPFLQEAITETLALGVLGASPNAGVHRG